MSILLDNFRIDRKILQKILDFLPYPFLVAEFRNGTHTNIFVNQKFKDEIGYTIAEIPTIEDWFDKAYPDPHYREEVIKTWGMRYRVAQRKKDNSVAMTAAIHTRDMGDKWYEVKSSVFGRVQLVAFVNINEVKLKEAELKRLNENKNKMLSILNHDLRGPIANLHALSQLALSHDLSKEEFLSIVRKVSEKTFQTLEFMDTTLIWTKSNFNALAIEIKSVDLYEIVNSILVVYDDSFKNKKLQMFQRIDSTAKFASDPGIITIAIRNLISNAIKFTPEGGNISIQFASTKESYTISVQDSGIGMAPGLIEEILSDTYASRKGTQEETGLGIGLKICRELLKSIKGRLDITSSPGQGSTMIILIDK